MFIGMFFGNYTYIKEYINSAFISGSLSSFICWSILMPIDYYGTNRLKGIDNILFSFNRIYSGYIPIIIRIIPTTGISMFVYEKIKELLN